MRESLIVENNVFEVFVDEGRCLPCEEDLTDRAAVHIHLIAELFNNF